MTRTLHRAAALFWTLVLVLATSQARADSFLTSVGTSSKTAARVGPNPYQGNGYTKKQAMSMARRGLTTIKHAKNAAIGFDVVRRVDGAAMYHPEAGELFRKGLAKLARKGDPRIQVLRGANLVRRNPSSRWGITKVRQAAKAAPNNSAVQLVAGLAVAQRDAFNPKLGHKWEKRTPLKREAAQYINQAQQLEKQTHHPRPLVREGLRQAKQYIGYYGGYQGLVK